MAGVPVSQMSPIVARSWMEARTTHGAYKGGKESTEHAIWRAMLARCSNPKNKDYHRYGGAGVQVCDRWRRFENFLADMGPRQPGLTLERNNTTGNYEPNNCRWASTSDQQKNKKRTRRWVGDDGYVGSLSEWADRLGISESLALYRLTYWGTFERGREWQLQKVK